MNMVDRRRKIGGREYTTATRLYDCGCVTYESRKYPGEWVLEKFCVPANITEAANCERLRQME